MGEMIHEPGEFVPGLGWSCLTCDTFGCPAVDHSWVPDGAGGLQHADEKCWRPAPCRVSASGS